jgi:hypothetical protein
MKVLPTIRRILALVVAVWAVAVAAYYLFFAKISFESITVSATTRYSGQTAWLSEAEPIAVVAMLTFSLLLAAGAVAGWRGALVIAATLSLLELVATYITGLSIGGLYFPGAIGMLLCTAVLAIEKRTGHLHPPAA